MNCSELHARACAYLGCRGRASEELLARVDDGLKEAGTLSHFRAVFREYTELLPFLRQSAYEKFLAGCRGYVLLAVTLGAEAEKRVRALMSCDPARAVVLDACASVLVEYEADKWEERFGRERTYRFCPGYGGTDAADNAFIFRELDPARIGMQLLPSGMIAPQKSMAGIVGLGRRAEKTCAGCMAAAGCRLKKEGRTCYGSENG